MRSDEEPSGILSNAGHEESCANPPGPSGKAKHSHETDSDEKHSDKESERDPETMRLQAVRAALCSDGVPFA